MQGTIDRRTAQPTQTHQKALRNTGDLSGCDKQCHTYPTVGRVPAREVIAMGERASEIGFGADERGSGVRMVADVATVHDATNAKARRDALDDVDFYFGCAEALCGLQAQDLNAEHGEASTSMAEFDFASMLARANRIGRELAQLEPRAREVLRETFTSRPWDMALRHALTYRKTPHCMAWVASRVPSAIRAMIGRGKAIDGMTPMPILVQEFLTWEARNNSRKVFDDGVRSEALQIVDWALDEFAKVRGS